MKVSVVSVHPLYDTRIYHHMRSLLEAGIDVEYINASPSGHSVGLKLPVIHIDYDVNINYPFSLIKIWAFIRRELKKSDSDIIHVHDLNILPATLGIKGKKVIFDRHERYERLQRPMSRLFSIYERLNIKKIAGCVCVDEDEEEYLRNIGYQHICCIPNYQSKLDFDKYTCSTSETDEINVIYIGSHSKIDRRSDLILDVCDILLSEHHNVRCIIGGSLLYDSLRDKVVELEQRHTKFQYIGTVTHDEVIQYTINADIGLLFFKDTPNTKYGSPNKLYEYLLGKTIFVGVGEFRLEDEIINTGAGLIFPYGVSAREICDRLNPIIEDSIALNDRKQAARVIGEHHTWESVCHRYIDIYDDVI